MSISFSRASWILILFCIVIVTAFGINIKNKFFPQVFQPPIVDTSISPEVLHLHWRASVSSILSQYDNAKDSRAAETSLLALRVPEQDKDVHLALTLAFHSLVQSRSEGQGMLKTARQQFEKVK